MPEKNQPLVPRLSRLSLIAISQRSETKFKWKSRRQINLPRGLGRSHTVLSYGISVSALKPSYTSKKNFAIVLVYKSKALKSKAWFVN